MSFATECDTSKSLLGKQKVVCKTGNCPSDSTMDIFEDGLLRRKYFYYNCRDSGMFLYFSEKGDTLTKSFFSGRKTIGLFRQWHLNKRPAAVIQYNDSGKKHGLCETWREDGTRSDSVVYNNGELVEERVYFADGKVRYHLVYGDKVNVRRVWYSGSIDTLDELTVANATFYSFKNGKIISSIKNGKGLATWCDSIGNNCSTETYLWGIEIETEKKICARPENAGPAALPEKGKCDCWVDVIKP